MDSFLHTYCAHNICSHTWLLVFLRVETGCSKKTNAGGCQVKRCPAKQLKETRCQTALSRQHTNSSANAWEMRSKIAHSTRKKRGKQHGPTFVTAKVGCEIRIFAIFAKITYEFEGYQCAGTQQRKPGFRKQPCGVE